MNWTRDRPARVGPYWIRSLDKTEHELVHVTCWYAGELEVHRAGSAEVTLLRRVSEDVEWFGPMEPPP